MLTGNTPPLPPPTSLCSHFFLAAIHPPAVHKICPCWTKTQEDEPPRGKAHIQMFYMSVYLSVFLTVGSSGIVRGSGGGVVEWRSCHHSPSDSPLLRLPSSEGEETLINGARKGPPVSHPEDLLTSVPEKGILKQREEISCRCINNSPIRLKLRG